MIHAFLRPSSLFVSRRVLSVGAVSWLSVCGSLLAQTGCEARLRQGGGLGGSIPVCQGSVVGATLARLVPNCSPFSTNGTFSEASRQPGTAGLIVLATRGRVVAPNSAAVYTSWASADATGDIRYYGPSTTLTLTLQIQGVENATQQQLTNHGFLVKCGPAPATGISLLPMGSTVATSRTYSFAVTNGATFDLSCTGFVATSGWQMPAGRWADWSFEVTLANATISAPGQSFALRSASLPIRYWPPVAPAAVTSFGQGCVTSAGAPTTVAVGVPSVGNGAFAIDVACPATSVALLGIGFAPVPATPIGNGCFVLTGNDLVPLQFTTSGTARFALPIPGAANLLGFAFEAQGAVCALANGELATASALRATVGY